MSNFDKKNIVMFSGGKDSTAMLFLMLEHNMPIHEVIFCDLGMDFPEMYDHIDKVEKLSVLKITKIKPDKPFGYYLGFHNRRRGNKPNEFYFDLNGCKVPIKGSTHKDGMIGCQVCVDTNIGYGWADMGVRWCTTIKKQTIKRYMKGLGDVVEFHGIATDEGERLNKNKDGRVIRYPLVEFGLSEADALQYCYNLGFDWGGLYKIKKRLSCWCCPLQNLDDLRYLYNHRPELWQGLKNLDSVSYRSFKPNATLKDIELRLQAENMQQSLFN